MHGFLLDIWQRTRTTIVFVTHDIAEAVTLADRICIMSLGPGSRIVEVIDVNLPRPRDIADPAAAKIFRKVEELLV
jgi:NitT/TauT family transport system ATP-binding protein